MEELSQYKHGRKPLLRLKQNNDEESSNEHDKQEDVEIRKIVGASSREVEEKVSSSKPQKKIKNPYDSKGKPKDKIELNLVQIKKPQNLEEALSLLQSSEWIQTMEEE